MTSIDKTMESMSTERQRGAFVLAASTHGVALQLSANEPHLSSASIRRAVADGLALTRQAVAFDGEVEAHGLAVDVVVDVVMTVLRGIVARGLWPEDRADLVFLIEWVEGKWRQASPEVGNE